MAEVPACSDRRNLQTCSCAGGSWQAQDVRDSKNFCYMLPVDVEDKNKKINKYIFIVFIMCCSTHLG